MPVPKSVSDCIARVLKSEMRKGETTKHGVTLLAMNQIGRANHYCLPPAMMYLAAQRIYSAEVERQLKIGLPENVLRQALSNAPPAPVQIMSKLPAWIATSEGRHARWVPSLLATVDDWMANAQLKQGKSRQTQATADASFEIAQYLSEYGLESLSSSIAVDVAA